MIRIKEYEIWEFGNPDTLIATSTRDGCKNLVADRYPEGVRWVGRTFYVNEVRKGFLWQISGKISTYFQGYELTLPNEA